MDNKKPEIAEDSFLKRKINENGGIKELIRAHNKIQDDTEGLVGQINDKLNLLKNEFLDELEKINNRLKIGEDVFIGQEDRIRKLEDDKQQRDKLNGKRDKDLEDFKANVNSEFKNLRGELGEMRKEISDNRKERREDIEKVDKNVSDSFKSLNITFKEGQRDNIKFVSLLFGASMAVVVPIIIAIIYILFNHVGKGGI